jgi:hypothetical protein
MDAVEQVKSHLRYGDVSEIAEQLDVKILKVWDYLNRERSKYDVRIMLAILRKAEQNIEMELMMIPEEEHPPRLMMRKYLDKIFKFYKTKEQPKVRPYVRPGQKKD